MAAGFIKNWFYPVSYTHLEFSAATKDYTATVDYSCSSLAVTANPADSKAIVTSVTGNDSLEVGENTVSVVVTCLLYTSIDSEDELSKVKVFMNNMKNVDSISLHDIYNWCNRQHVQYKMCIRDRIYSFACNFTCPVCCYSGAYALFSNSHRTRN